MSAKAQLIHVMDFVGENEALQILQFIKNTFSLKSRSWDDVEEDNPTKDEIAAFEAYRKGE